MADGQMLRLMAMFAPELTDHNIIDNVKFDIVWRIIINMIKHGLIWP
jgi:hypothetical protein